MFDFDDFMDTAQLIGILFSVVAVLAGIITCTVYKSQRDEARATIQQMKAEAQALQIRLDRTILDADRVRREDAQALQAWAAAHPAPRDPEALRQWLIQAARR